MQFTEPIIFHTAPFNFDLKSPLLTTNLGWLYIRCLGLNIRLVHDKQPGVRLASAKSLTFRYYKIVNSLMHPDAVKLL